MRAFFISATPSNGDSFLHPLLWERVNFSLGSFAQFESYVSSFAGLVKICGPGDFVRLQWNFPFETSVVWFTINF
jgi:hypothetical protein